MYLAEEPVWNVLRYVMGRPGRQRVVFDYARRAVQPQSRSNGPPWPGMTSRVARAGEPWTAFFEPEALDARPARLGARAVVDLDGAAINARYFAGRERRAARGVRSAT